VIVLRLPGPAHVAELIDSLLAHAVLLEGHAPELAAAKRRFADELGDGLDQLPTPTTTETTDA
jgi:hypothetical protein